MAKNRYKKKRFSKNKWIRRTGRGRKTASFAARVKKIIQLDKETHYVDVPVTSV